jgi:hypothetical protein
LVQLLGDKFFAFVEEDVCGPAFNLISWGAIALVNGCNAWQAGVLESGFQIQHRQMI